LVSGVSVSSSSFPPQLCRSRSVRSFSLARRPCCHPLAINLRRVFPFFLQLEISGEGRYFSTFFFFPPPTFAPLVVWFLAPSAALSLLCAFFGVMTDSLLQLWSYDSFYFPSYPPGPRSFVVRRSQFSTFFVLLLPPCEFTPDSWRLLFYEIAFFFWIPLFPFLLWRSSNDPVVEALGSPRFLPPRSFFAASFYTFPLVPHANPPSFSPLWLLRDHCLLLLPTLRVFRCRSAAAFLFCLRSCRPLLFLPRLLFAPFQGVLRGGLNGHASCPHFRYP